MVLLHPNETICAKSKQRNTLVICMQIFTFFFWPLIHYVFLNYQKWSLQICAHSVLEDLKTNYNWRKK